jgi:photosystem II stability/assembly factor-like uncharacterized protein
MNKAMFYSAAKLAGLIIVVMVLGGASCGLRIKTATPNGGVYRTTDAGKTWQQVVYVGQVKDKAVTIANLDIKQLYVSPLDNKLIYAVAGREGVYESTDAGANWHRFFNTLVVEDMVLNPQTRDIMYLAAENRILRTTNGGKDWQGVYLESTSDVIITTLAIDKVNPKVLYAGTSNGSLLKSIDSGNSWQQVHFFKFKQRLTKVAVQSEDGRIIYVAQPAGNLWRTADGGQNWIEVSQALRDKLKVASGAYRALALIPGVKDALLYATQYGMFRSVDGGQNWTEVKLVTPPNSVAIASLVINPARNQDIFYVAPAAFYRSTDGGASWETLPLPADRKPSSLVISGSDAKTLYLSFTR